MRHLQESLAVKRAKVEERRLLHHPPGSTDAFDEVVRTFGPNQGLLNGRRLSIGQVRGLTILVNFQDVTSTTTAADVEEMLNGDNFTRNGNICSVREYFLRVSNGKLDYTNTVVGPFTLSQNREHYLDNLLVEEALQLAVAAGLDLTQFDSRNEGIVDALNILYAGQSVLHRRVNLWPHNFSSTSSSARCGPTSTCSPGSGRNPSELSIGTFCHENGHLLCRFPDMYDYGERDERQPGQRGHRPLLPDGGGQPSGLRPQPRAGLRLPARPGGLVRHRRRSEHAGHL